jgi:hypothetical protein
MNNKTKYLGSSVPFQLNCTLDDIDLLSNASTEKTVELSDDDNDDIIIINTEHILTEEKLHQQTHELLETPKKEHVSKIDNDMQVCKNNTFLFYDKMRKKNVAFSLRRIL